MQRPSIGTGTLNVTSASCIRLHTSKIYVQVTAFDQLKAPRSAIQVFLLYMNPSEFSWYIKQCQLLAKGLLLGAV